MQEKITLTLTLEQVEIIDKCLAYAWTNGPYDWLDSPPMQELSVIIEEIQNNQQNQGLR